MTVAFKRQNATSFLNTGRTLISNALIGRQYLKQVFKTSSFGLLQFLAPPMMYTSWFNVTAAAMHRPKQHGAQLNSQHCKCESQGSSGTVPNPMLRQPVHSKNTTMVEEARPASVFVLRLSSVCTLSSQTCSMEALRLHLLVLLQ